MTQLARAGAILALASGVSVCRLPQTLPDCVEDPPAEEGAPRIETGGDPVLLAAGDIVDEDLAPAEATARLLDQYDGQVATLGEVRYG